MSSTTFAILSALGVCAYILYTAYRLRTRPKDTPPFAKGWMPVLGHTLSMIFWDPIADSKRDSEAINQGNPPPDTVELELITGLRFYISWDPEVARAVLTNSSINSRSIPNPEGLKELGGFHQGLFFNTDIESWKLNRKYFLESLGKPRFLNSVPERITTFLDTLFPLLDKCADTNTIVPMNDVFGSLSMDLIMDISCSQHDNATHHLLLKVLKEVDPQSTQGTNMLGLMKKIMAATDFFIGVPEVLYQYVPPFTWKANEFRLDEKTYDEVLNTIISTRMKQMEEGTTDNEKPDLLTSFILAGGDNNSRMDIKQVSTSMKEVLLGGTDTSSSTMAFLVYELAKNPEVQEQLYEEVNQIIAPGQSITREQLDKLAFLEATICESLRMHMVAPGVPREIKNDIKVGKYLLKGGSVLFLSNIINVYVEKYFPNPTKFNPSRFLERHENLGGPLGLGFTYTPFGYGVRKCPGEALAMMEMKAVMASLVQRYKFKIADPKNPMRKHVAFTIECEHLPIYLQRRDC